jgi:hypothetical protein
MKENQKKEILGEEPEQADDQADFIQKFIDQTKLQNRILGEIIEKINKAERNKKSQTINKNQKP